MSVKVENRPENRFELYNRFNRLSKGLLVTVASDRAFSGSMLFKPFLVEVFKSLAAVRSNMLSFNFCDVFDDDMYRKRISFQMKVLDGANSVKAHLEGMLAVTNFESSGLYGEYLKALDLFVFALRRLMASDKVRHRKGKVAVAKEYSAAKKVNFHKKEVVDHGDTDPGLLKHEDPLDVGKLVFV